MTTVIQPFPFFADLGGDPLDEGYIYIGLPNQNPETSPKQAYWDAALTIPATQPLRTLEGYIARNGAPARVFVNGEFSMTVRNKRGSLVFTLPQADALSSYVSWSELALPGSAALIGEISPVTGAVARTQQSKNNDVVSVFDFMTADQIAAVKAGTATNNATQYQTAVDNVPDYTTLVFPAGTHRGYIQVWRSNITIKLEGTLKLPDNCPSVTVPWEGGGTISGLPNVIEIGKCALGNIAPKYVNVAVIGEGIVDGNYASNTAPTTDLFGHGIIATNVDYLTIKPKLVKDCFAACVDVVINCNYHSVDTTVDNGGNALINSAYYPNFDINSSSNGTSRVRSKGGKYGGRMLDNCNGNVLDLTAKDPSITGFVANNQSVNQSKANQVKAAVIGGCAGGPGASIGANVFGGKYDFSVTGVAGAGVQVSGSTGVEPRGNKINTNTTLCGASGILAGGKFNDYTIVSRRDGQTGAAGTSFAVEVTDSDNRVTVQVEDAEPTPQVRGLVLRVGAQRTTVLDYKHNTTVQDFLNQDVSGTSNWYFQYVGDLTNVRRPITLAAGWSASFGAPYIQPCYYRDLSGWVHVLGSITGGAGTAFTLPAGFRPTEDITFPTIANGAPARLQITSAGVVTLIAGTATVVELSAINFPTY